MIAPHWSRILVLLLGAGCARPAAMLAATTCRYAEPLEVRRADPFPRVIRDASGAEVRVPEPPERIASGTLFTDCVLLAICPEDRIAALNEVSTKPQFSAVAEASAGFHAHLTMDPETYLAVRPDLVFLASFSNRRLQRLVTGGDRRIVRLRGLQSLAEVQASIRLVGYVTGLDDAAEDLVRRMQARLDHVSEGAEARRKWRLLSWSNGFVAGTGSLFDEIVGVVGARNLAADEGVELARRLSPERVLAMEPDALVLGALPGQEDEEREKLRAVVALRGLRAVKEGRIVFVPSNVLAATSHHVAAAAEIIAATLDRWDRE